MTLREPDTKINPKLLRDKLFKCFRAPRLPSVAFLLKEVVVNSES